MNSIIRLLAVLFIINIFKSFSDSFYCGYIAAFIVMLFLGMTKPATSEGEN
jgi:hypothetical protein